MTPDTTSSYYAAYTITALVYIGYAFYIWRRAKRVRERLAAKKADPSRSLP
jgi:hypothetical protein